jgi:septum formation protein
MTEQQCLILGSGSPRRLDLLGHLIDKSRIEVIVPDCDELSLNGLHSSQEIDEMLQENVRRKQTAIAQRIGADTDQVVLCADTVVVVAEGKSFRCLGKPPTENWEPVVERWFNNYYALGPHWVRTGFSMTRAVEGPAEIVQTEVRFRSDVNALLPWYLSTAEPIGKAGGYAIQGAGSIFVKQIDGSISNVIGLPLERTLHALTTTGFLQS